MPVRRRCHVRSCQGDVSLLSFVLLAPLYRLILVNSCSRAPGGLRGSSAGIYYRRLKSFITPLGWNRVTRSSDISPASDRLPVSMNSRAQNDVTDDVIISR